MNWYEIIVRSPVDRVARRVTAQTQRVEDDQEISADEMKFIYFRLMRKASLLKEVLRIKNKSQHKNVKTKYKNRTPQFRDKIQGGRAIVEYRRVNIEIGRFCVLVSAKLKQEKLVRHLAHVACDPYRRRDAA